MFLLLDECCAKSLATVAEAAGHIVQRSVEVAVLGKGAPDAEVFDWARGHDANLATVNAGDFIALAGRGRDHPGVLLIPSLPIAQLGPLFLVLLRAAAPLFDASPNLFVEIDAAGRLSSFSLPR